MLKLWLAIHLINNFSYDILYLRCKDNICIQNVFFIKI